MRIYLIASILLIIGLSSCTSDCIEIGEAKIDQEVWNYQDSVVFTLNAEDTTHYYDLVLELEHSPEFNFQNLYVRSTTYFPNGDHIKDPISLNLGDLSGSWNGDCSGKRCKAPVLLRSKFRFQETGDYRLVFEQFSRMESVTGIMQMRLLLCDQTDTANQ